MHDPGRGVEMWKRYTSAFDRVRSIAQTLSQPRPASWIADEAAVDRNTAHEHLEQLVELNVLREVPGKNATVFEPDPLHLRLQTVRELLETHDRIGLLGVKESLQTEIEGWQSEYSVESPDALRELAAGTETADETRHIAQTASTWELVAYRLSVVEEAIENCAEYTGDSTSA